MISAWAAALEASIKARDETPGDEWKTTKQIGEETGLSYSHAGHWVKRLQDEGRAERKDFRIEGRMVPHYRLIEVRVASSGS